MKDRAALLQAITATTWNVASAAAQLGMAPTTLAYQLRRHGIHRPSRPAPPAEAHAPSAALAAELDQLRIAARLLFRSYGPCPYRVQELARIEARTRYLRVRLRAALGEPETGSGMTSRPHAPGATQPAWGQRWFG